MERHILKLSLITEIIEGATANFNEAAGVNLRQKTFVLLNKNVFLEHSIKVKPLTSAINSESVRHCQLPTTKFNALQTRIHGMAHF